MARAGSRALLPSARGTSGGALVGETTTGPARKIHFPQDLLRRHHLYVARTRMGKSTLMEHVIAHKLKEKAAGNDTDAIIVVDPHADLVGSVLAQVPESLIDSVKLIDLADQRGYPGINLLDTRIFADRDRTADSVVRVAHGLWEQWGPRMQSILEHAVKSLHEANEKRQPETSTPSWTGCASSPTTTSGTRPWGRWTTITCSGGGPGSSAPGGGTTRAWPWPRCRPGWPTTPPPRRQGPSWASLAPPSTCARPSWAAASCWCPPPRAPWVGTWPRWWDPPS